MAATKFNTRFGLISALWCHLAEAPVDERHNRGWFEYATSPFDATPAQLRAAFLHLTKCGALTKYEHGEDGIAYYLDSTFTAVARGVRLAADGLIYFRGPMRAWFPPKHGKECHL